MAALHRINLSSAWKPIAESEGRTVGQQRVFHPPSQLDANQAVWLVIEAFDRGLTIRLNDQFVGEFSESAAPVRVDIRHLLRPNNRLELLYPESEAPFAPRVYLEL